MFDGLKTICGLATGYSVVLMNIKKGMTEAKNRYMLVILICHPLHIGTADFISFLRAYHPV